MWYDLNQVPEKESEVSQVPAVELIKDFLQVTLPYSKEYIASIKSVGYSRWDPKGKVWIVPNSAANLEKLKVAFPSLVMGPVLRGEGKVEAENLLEAEVRKYLPKNRDLEITDFEFKTTPYLHQKITFNFCRSLNQTAIFLEQGLGKTLIAASLATWRFRNNQIRRVLVVAPNSVVPQWRTEDVTKHLSDDFRKVTILEGGSKNRIKLLEKVAEIDEPGFLIVNYEALAGLKDYIVSAQCKKVPLFGMMICDESSKIKHAMSQRSKVAWQIGKTVEYRNILTGTPITQSAEDIFSQYRFLKPSVFGAFATAFRGTYLMMGGWENRQIIGYRNIADLFSKIFSIGIRFEKEMCLDLPKKTYQTRFAKLDEEISEKYRQLEKECIAEFGGKNIATPLVLTKLIKLSQVVNGFIYEQDETGKQVAVHIFEKNPKMEVLEEILDEVLPNKIIIWTRFKYEIELITFALKERAARAAKAGKKFSHATIHGGVPQNERGAEVQRFQIDPACQVFVGQVATAGLGITLTAATCTVYFSNSYALEDRLQSEDRNHRIGQTKSVNYIDIVATLYNGRRTIDADVLEIIKGKASFANEVSRALISRMMDREIDKPKGGLASVVTSQKKKKEEATIEEGEEF